MHPAQSQLYADHYNLLRLLACFQSEMACFESEADNSSLRLSVILDIFDYVRVYPERYHHPLENKLFEQLLVKNIPQSELIWGARSEHHSLEKLTQEANQLFSAVANDMVVPMAELVEAARNFIDRQLAHINIENRDIYPLVDQYITSQDWELISREMDNKPDPFFNESIRQEYHHLYRSILRAERGVALGDSQHSFARAIYLSA